MAAVRRSHLVPALVALDVERTAHHRRAYSPASWARWIVEAGRRHLRGKGPRSLWGAAGAFVDWPLPELPH
jgi:hypothetical protein